MFIRLALFAVLVSCKPVQMTADYRSETLKIRYKRTEGKYWIWVPVALVAVAVPVILAFD